MGCCQERSTRGLLQNLCVLLRVLSASVCARVLHLRVRALLCAFCVRVSMNIMPRPT